MVVIILPDLIHITYCNRWIINVFETACWCLKSRNSAASKIINKVCGKKKCSKTNADQNHHYPPWSAFFSRNKTFFNLARGVTFLKTDNNTVIFWHCVLIGFTGIGSKFNENMGLTSYFPIIFIFFTFQYTGIRAKMYHHNRTPINPWFIFHLRMVAVMFHFLDQHKLKAATLHSNNHWHS